jgi:hypothetical protein
LLFDREGIPVFSDAGVGEEGEHDGEDRHQLDSQSSGHLVDRSVHLAFAAIACPFH